MTARKSGFIVGAVAGAGVACAALAGMGMRMGTADAAPALNTLIAAIPDEAAVMYLHDLAIDPSVRGGGWSRPIVERLVQAARAAGWPALTLVAVNDAAPFWERHGFVVADPPGMAGKLAGYGPDARPYEILYILDNTSQTLFVYSIERAADKRILLRDGRYLPSLFRTARGG